MNKKDYPNFADKFKIKVWSDSSTKPIDLQVLETGIFSGKFKGRIFISDMRGGRRELSRIMTSLMGFNI